jgi:hypothetical protein
VFWEITGGRSSSTQSGCLKLKSGTAITTSGPKGHRDLHVEQVSDGVAWDVFGQTPPLVFSYGRVPSNKFSPETRPQGWNASLTKVVS